MHVLFIGGTDSCINEFVQLGAKELVVLGGPEFAHLQSDGIASVIRQVVEANQFDAISATSASGARDYLPRLAGMLDWPMVTDVIAIASSAKGPLFRRAVYAGNLVATVQVEGGNGVFSIRGTSFDAPQRIDQASPIRRIEVSLSSSSSTEWLGLESSGATRPDLTSARVVVSGGRPLRDSATFERLIGGLADKLNGAAGATRAAVDSGIAPNELQIGQTGKIVAPDLYIAAGVSGSVQHLAGMKDSKTIIAINTDPNAPIFQVADYGLVMDLYQAIPALMEQI